MWKKGTQQDSGLGCNHKSVCGSKAFVLKANPDWKLQYFCKDEVHKAIDKKYGDLPYSNVLDAVDKPFWYEFQSACKTHKDCKALTGGDDLYCLDHRWDFTNDGKSHTIGKACYKWDKNVCSKGVKTPSWAMLNSKYDLMKFSHFSQTWCVNDDSTKTD